MSAAPSRDGAPAGASESLELGAPITDRAWFDRPSPAVARDLVGMWLVHDAAGGRVAGRIVETEAYQGPEDLAAHSARGRTERNAVMFGPAGHAYVYFVYGLHHCLNVVCGPGAKPEAVLLRAAAITEGQALARQRRGTAVPPVRLAAGPGNLTAAFGVDRAINGSDLISGPLWLATGSVPAIVIARPRVGVDYAGTWARRRLRFLAADDPHVSRR
ncbi:MAG: DNA-3-methyladenine glycosylase [Candidatus Limnocylindria bacterium]